MAAPESTPVPAAAGLKRRASPPPSAASDSGAEDVGATAFASSSVSSSKRARIDRAVPALTGARPQASVERFADADDVLAVERRTMDPTWFRTLRVDMEKDSFASLKKFLAAEQAAGKKIYPPPPLVHSWSRLTPLDTVKVVVVGQDPYHGPGQACGHSFSVPKGIAVPGSLKNIYKELKAEYPDFRIPTHGCLDAWARQGVLLLNACLTVEDSKAGSHHGKGWEPFTRSILRAVAARAAAGPPVPAALARDLRASTVKGDAATESSSKKPTKSGGPMDAFVVKAKKKPDPQVGSSSSATAVGKEAVSIASAAAPSEATQGATGTVFLVWGKPAAKMVADAGINEKSPNVLVLHSAHPSPLSASRGFLGNGHFAATNRWLEGVYGEGGGIVWTL